MTAGLFIIALLVCLFLGIPIFIAMMIPSTYYLLNVLNMQPIMAVSSFTAGLNKFSTLCLPFFILAASVMGKGQIGSRLLKFCRSIVGHMYGGIGMTAIVCCIIIGAISGASTAGILIIGALIYQEMIDNGYPRGFSAGLICTVSSVGMLIPPGIAFVVYAMNTNTSVLKLFMGGLSSGIVMAAIFMVYVYVYARRHKVPRLPRISLKEFFTAVKEAIWALGLPVIIIGTMYTGICTPTEAAAISAVYAIFVEMVIYKDVDFKTLIDICGDCAKTVCTIYILLAAGQLLGYVMTLARIPQLMEAMLGSTSRLMILLVINIMFLIAGMFMGAGSSIVIIMPMVYQLALKAGIDPIFLGNVVVTNLAIGMSTPPFGLNLFVSAKVMKLSFVEIVRSSMPFIMLTILVLIIITLFPGLSLFLPNLVVE